VAELIVTFKRENPSWGQRRIREELRRMGICVSAPTVVRILREHGFSPQPGRKIDFSRVRAAAKDALWALDFFAVQTGKGVWLLALVIIDIYTRELLELHIRVADAKDLQFFLDEYRAYANTERPHQGLCGRTPEEASTGLPEAEVIDMAAARERRLVRRPYAHGLLQGYSLVGDGATGVAA
jgi:hypothetical protein